MLLSALAPCAEEDTLRISFPRKCVVSAFGYSGFSMYPNLIGIDGLEEDFTGWGSSGAEGARQSRRLGHLQGPTETCALSGRAVSTDMGFYDSPIRFTGSRK